MKRIVLLLIVFQSQICLSQTTNPMKTKFTSWFGVPTLDVPALDVIGGIQFYPTANKLGFRDNTVNRFLLTENNALNTYVPLTRALTINGTTLDLSENRTFTISTASYTAGNGLSLSGSQFLVDPAITSVLNVAQTYTSMPTYSSGNKSIFYNVDNAAGTNREIRFSTSGINRWYLRVDGVSESGSNVGSDFSILRRADDGSNLGTVLSINRSTGVVTVPSIAATGSLVGNSSTATTLQTARTINGVSFNGSANITIPVGTGTVTSVTRGIGFQNSGTSITTTGTLDIDTATGTSGLARKGFVTDYAYSRAQANTILNQKAVLVGGNTFSGAQQMSGSYITSGTVNALSITPTLVQSGSANYRALFISPYESTVGSGGKTLIEAGTNTASDGSGTHTTKFRVDNDGTTYIIGNVVSTPAPTATNHLANKDYVDARGNGYNFLASGNGSTTAITIPHGLSGISGTSVVVVTPKNSASAGVTFATIDATNVTINYTVAPVSGTNNLSYSIFIKP